MVPSMPDEKRVIIFTDLDGTLLDYATYSFNDALPALTLIKERSIPLVICSSKTATEIEYHRKNLENHHPFVSENGGGIFVPKGYFGFRVKDLDLCKQDASIRLDSNDTYEIVRLGARYDDLRRVLNVLRQNGFLVRGFGDMSDGEISMLTGLPIEEAMLAKQREFDEPFVVDGDQDQIGLVKEVIEGLGFHYVEGRIGHIIGASDKGKAVSLLISLYETILGSVATIGIGDAPNDIPMLQGVDHPVVVQQPDGSYHGNIRLEGLILADGKGPVGWNRAIMDLLTRERFTGLHSSPL
jgi:mannosyl-3-phosphoglycerate phosphatase